MKIYNDIEQRSAEWHSIRNGKFTGSDFYICMSDKETETKNNLIYNKAVERITKKDNDTNNFINQAMIDGIEREEEARKSYELETGNIVNEVGFVELNNFIGCSPDFVFLDENKNIKGIGEIKNPTNKVFLQTILNKEIKKEYMIQMQFNMYVCKVNYCDYVVYNPNFKKSLLIQRVERDEELIDKIKTKLDECIKKVNEIVEKYNNFISINKNEEIPFLDNLQDLVKEEELKDEEKSYNRIIK